MTLTSTQEPNYDDSSPLFDVPEIPPLRRVVPLPKRRRTLIDPPAASAPTERVGSPTLDELASTLSTSMALQSQSQTQSPQYSPLFEGSGTLTAASKRSGPRGPGPRLAMIKDDIDSRHVNPDDIVKVDSFAQAYAFAAARAERDDADREDGDYTDHLRQPGNTKKRKVPVAAVGAVNDEASAANVDTEEFMERSFRELEERSAAIEALNALTIPALPTPLHLGKAARLSRAARAALMHKEMIKSRKKQLSIIVGTLSQYDPLALDAALYDYPLSKGTGRDARQPLVRLSRRPERRRSRTFDTALKELPVNQTNDNAKVPECDFTFESDSASERLVLSIQSLS